jgi:hypothetical protein
MSKKKKEKDEISYGLSAYGKSGEIEFELHEALPPAREILEIQISTGGLCLDVTIASIDEIYRVLNFMKTNYGKTDIQRKITDEFPDGILIYKLVDEINIVLSANCNIFLSKDGELPDRFNCNISGQEFGINFDLHDPQVSNLIAALEDGVNDLGG